MPRLAASALIAAACSVAIVPSGAAETRSPARARGVATQPAAAAPVPEPPAGVAYGTWLRGLSRSDRQRLHAFCRKHPVEPEAACGGIGPLHIPEPPSMLPPPKGAASSGPTFTRDDWRKTLTRAQRAYVERYCRSERWAFSTLCGGTPLVVSFDGGPVRFTDAPGAFDLRPGDPVATDWPTAQTPWLAIDLDGDGQITSGAELFGSSTALPDGTPARHGFDALAALDANRDGRIDRRDPRFGALLLWADRDADRRSAPDELSPAAALIESISLAYRFDARCDARLNCEGERAIFRWRDGAHVREGAVVDVYLHYR
jgi:hypothetical protein